MDLNQKSAKEAMTWCKIRRFFALPFSPHRLETWFSVGSVEEISPDKLTREGIQGVLLDADGTLGPHHFSSLPETVVQHIRVLQAEGLRVAIFTNASGDRFRELQGIPVVTDILAKPDPKSFRAAMKNELKLNAPKTVCMVGDNYVTDGGAIDAGMRFIYVFPKPGNEAPLHRMFRFLAYLCAWFYGKI